MQQTIKYIIASMILMFSSLLYALEVGDQVSNTASVVYTYHGVVDEVKSNEVTHTIEESEAIVSFLYPSTTGPQRAVLGTSAYLDENGVWHESQASTLDDGTTIGNDSLLSFEETDFYRPKDMVIISVVDADQNINRHIRDVTEVNITSQNGDIETLQLRETSTNSGVFLAYIPLSDLPKDSYDNHLSARLSETIVVVYNDNAKIAKSDSAVILEKKEFNVWIEKQVNKTEASIGEVLEYTLVVHNDEESVLLTCFSIQTLNSFFSRMIAESLLTASALSS